jgi:hypothetical protein
MSDFIRPSDAAQLVRIIQTDDSQSVDFSEE